MKTSYFEQVEYYSIMYSSSHMDIQNLLAARQSLMLFDISLFLGWHSEEHFQDRNPSSLSKSWLTEFQGEGFLYMFVLTYNHTFGREKREGSLMNTGNFYRNIFGQMIAYTSMC